nr:uncharacterized protein LOC121114208 [Lepeophtheirus salmonis]XP_040564022.1 uncharacterized protein LOC121114208 [Lepeophtheirus salmonis]
MTPNYGKIYRIWLTVEIVLLLLIGIMLSVLFGIYYSKQLPLVITIVSVMQLLITYGSLIGIRYMAIKTSLRCEIKWVYAELTCTGFTLIALVCVVILSIGLCICGQVYQGIIIGISSLIFLKVVAIKFFIGHQVASILDEKRCHGILKNAV